MLSPYKRLFDFIIAITIIPVSIIPISIIGILILIFDRNMPIFAQRRVGLYEQTFFLYKFRSMNSKDDIFDSSLGAGVVNSNDSRVTKLGAFLRKTSLDELPQLFNLLIGDISIVGPRPAMLNEMEESGFNKSVIQKRCLVRPGLTGLAQISGRNDLNWHDKMKLDLEYVCFCRANYSIFKDIFIILKTIPMVLFQRSIVEPYNRDK